MKSRTKFLRIMLFPVMGFFMLLSGKQIEAQSDGEVVNLGLYGGMAIDLTYCNTNQRLFAGVNTPASIFFTDDDGSTWTQPFQIDSLEYEDAQRGWGGGARKIITNSKGWVAVQTAQQGGTLTSAVVSYSEGDSGSFHTAMDKYLLHQIQPAFSPQSVTGMGLSDHYQYIGLEQYLVRINDTSTYGIHNVISRTDTITGIGANYRILDIAVANDETGYPVFLITGTSGNEGGTIYRFDGTNFTQLTVTGLPHRVEKIFTHPHQTAGDTIIASIRNTTTNIRSIYISKNGGSSWTDITPSYGTNWPLHSVDYSASWVSSMPLSNGLQLSFPGGGVSNDLGSSWTTHVLPDNSMATHPTSTMQVAGSYGRGVAFSMSGPEGAFIIQDNEGLAAVGITKIARSKGIYYVSTNAGLGYTNAYFDETITGIIRWQPPYGEFPIAGVGDDSGVSAVAVSPTDSLHVVAGHSNGFSVSYNGPIGFSNVTPAGWNTSGNIDARVTDLTFINDNVVVAVTGSGSNELQFPSSPYGNIWRSEDGGNSWTMVTPPGFLQGNTIEAGTANGDTVLFAGTGYFDMNYPKVDGAVWRSDDLGISWSYVNNGPTGLMSGTLYMPVYDIDVDPRGNDTLYIASGQNLDYALVQSFDGGNTYHYTTVVPHGAFSSVLVDQRNPDVISCGARRNVFRLNTITNVIDTTFFGLPGEFVPDLENGSTLLGTNTGFYKIVEDFGIDTTFWNGNGNWSEAQYWSNGLPQYWNNAVIESGHITIDEAFEVNDLIVNPLADMTVSEQGALSINGNLILYSDETGSASFIDQRTGATNINARIERYFSSSQWHQFSSSTNDATASSFNFGNSSETQIVAYDENTNSWNTIDSETYPLEPGQGFAMYIESANSSETATYSGRLNKGNQTVGLDYSGADHGWNLIGNPFPSAIDWNQGDWNCSLTTFVVYVYDHGNYLARNVFGHGTLESGIIPAGQGFFMQASAAGASVVIPENARVHNNQTLYKETGSFNDAMMISVEINGKKDKTWLGFDANASDYYDNSWDAERFDGEADMPKLYTTLGESKMSINMMDELTGSRSVPLYFEAAENGTYQLNFSLIESFVNDTIFLVDLLTNTEQDIRLNPVYSFNAVSGDDPMRFKLEFNSDLVGLSEATQQNQPVISVNTSGLRINWPNKTEAFSSIRITDLSGRILGQYQSNHSSTLEIETSDWAQQFILLQIIDHTAITTRKIYLP